MNNRGNQQTLPWPSTLLDPQQGSTMANNSSSGGPLWNSEFEADLAKAMDLSLAEEEELCTIANKYDPPVSKQQQQQQQQQCPVCDDYFALSTVEFKQHVDHCLDQDDDDMATKASSTWRQFFKSIPTVIQDTLVGKGTPTNHYLEKSDTTINSDKERQVPDYKWMKDTKFVVDAFSYGKISGCEGYFLTHFHSDHYHGLTQSWNHGPIFCSQITANLVRRRLNVESNMIHILPMDQPPTFIHPTIKVTLIDANHCPGSALFIFDIQRPEGVWIRHLHTGDFRANPAMCLHPLLRQPENPTIDHLYLDTTYLDAKYGFPAQDESIQAACRLVEEHISPDVLIAVGSYSIGKEKVFLSIAQLLQSKIFVTSVKKTFLECLESKDLENMLTDDQKEAQVHVLPLNDIKAENMHAYLKSLSPRFNKLIAFKPTGWTFQANDDTSMEIPSLSQVILPPADRRLTLTPQHDSDTLKIYGVPYSEHSSFRELASFIASLDIKHVMPTVNCESQKSQDRMMLYLEKWKHDKQDRTIQVVPYTVESHW